MSFHLQMDKNFGAISSNTSLQFGSVTQSCPTLWNPMDCSTPGLPVHHQLPELVQTHVQRVGDAIQPSHPLSSPSPPAFNLSQHWVFSSELDLRIRWLKYWNFSFSISPSNEYSGLISSRIDWFDLLAVKGLSRVFSSTTIQKHQSSTLSLIHGPTLTFVHDYWKNHSFDYTDLCQQSDVSAF